MYTRVFIIFIIAIIIAAGAYMVFLRTLPNPPVYCTQEAKLCPDGSYVGRSGPKCEFAECPPYDDPTQNWKTASSTEERATFKYPETFGQTYANEVDWPPKIQILDERLTCTEAGSETGRAGITEQKNINGEPFCVTRVSEGAAGSIYTQYAYASQHGGKEIIFTFSLRKVQCGNYDASQKMECEREQAAFNPDSVIGRMAASIVLSD